MEASMSDLIKKQGVVIDLTVPTEATITYQGRTGIFTYGHEGSDQSDAIKADVVNWLIADSIVGNYPDYQSWHKDHGFPRSKWDHDRAQTKLLKQVLGADWSMFLQQYNTNQ